MSTTSIPSQHRLRAELEAMVLGDLLGPAGGEAEELTERTVRDRYLVGVLAPSRSASTPATTASKTADDDADEDDELPLIPDELPAGGSDSTDDGKTDADIPLAQSHLPSSFGMTFCIDGDANEFVASASWGQYKKEEHPDKYDQRGNPQRVWRRHPRGGSVSIPLCDGPITPRAPDPEFPDVYLQGRVRHRNSQFLVTLFLVNAQEEARPKDECHLFQPKLSVSAADGRAVFRKRAVAGNRDDLEERLTAMLYRHHVEFAVGHGIGVHATLGDGRQVAGDALAGEINGDPEPRAIRIETVVVPTYEVPRTAPTTEADAGENPAFGKLAGLVLDMKVLAESDAKKLPKQLEPLLAAYRDWIDREHAKLSDPREGLAQFGDAGPVAIANCRRTLQRIEEGLALISKDASARQAFLFTQRPWRSRQARPTHRRGTDPRHGFERTCYRHRSLRDTRCDT